MINELLLTVVSASWLFELTRVLVRFDHVARFIVNPNHKLSEKPKSHLAAIRPGL